MGNIMTLDKGTIDSKYILENMNLPINIEKRLEAIGMTQGTTIKILNNKNEGTIIVYVRGTRFAMGKNISKNITVSEIKG